MFLPSRRLLHEELSRRRFSILLPRFPDSIFDQPFGPDFFPEKTKKEVKFFFFLGNKLKNFNSFVFYIMAIFQKTNFKLGGFLGCYTFLTKFLLCLIRRVRNNDAGVNSFISGAVAGFFSLMLQPKSSRHVWRTYLWMRAFVKYLLF